jgi:hypothetical protein
MINEVKTYVTRMWYDQKTNVGQNMVVKKPSHGDGKVEQGVRRTAVVNSA